MNVFCHVNTTHMANSCWFMVDLMKGQQHERTINVSSKKTLQLTLTRVLSAN